MKTIICPRCKQTFELSEALTHEIEESLISKEREKQKIQLEKATKAAIAKYSLELKILQEENIKKDKLLKESQEIEINLRKQKNKLDEEKRTFELEKQRQLDEERDKIRQKTMAELFEKQRLEKKEYEETINGLKKSLDDARRKAEQGSMQIQGEVQELDLEDMLKRNFPHDSIEPVGKGVTGADIRQIVRSPLGTDCGRILWESKRTKTWSDGWISKLKQDLLNDKSHIPVIISDALPEEAKIGIGKKDGVYIANSKLAYILAELLRTRLLEVTKQKRIYENKQTKSESLYTYVTSHEFQNQVEAMIETYQSMYEQIHKERIVFERTWKLREQQVQKLLNGVAGIYGSMQGVVGQALPSVKGLEFVEGEIKQITD